MDKQVEIYKLAMKENVFTVLATALCVAGVAIGTGSLHCFWGLVILSNINTFNKEKKKAN